MAKTLEEERLEADRTIGFLREQLAKYQAGERTYSIHPGIPDSPDGLMLGLNDWIREREIIMRLEGKDRVMRQVDALGLSRFRIGVLTFDAAGEKHMQLFTWDRERLAKSLSWLRGQNAGGANINIGPASDHALTLIDDVKREALQRMKAEGFQPAVVVETSRNNFQAWVNHGQVLTQEIRRAAAKQLASEFGGDPSAAAHAHMGRLAGFTNRKEIHRTPDGKYPWVHLVEAVGAVYPRAQEFVKRISLDVEKTKVEEQKRVAAYAKAPTPAVERNLKTIHDFRNDLRYAGDGNRADIAYARYAIARGVPATEIRAAIRTRDLSKKGPEKAQEDYVKRTVEKAARGLSQG